ncbi:MAG TPA: SusC/RagA family TonB-linked outer membrane protein, partial [Chitinophagales bacterium]|nr:SusC/RagA family TonB-linked outer membrane protein [Chitinophagales bacterium]
CFLFFSVLFISMSTVGLAQTTRVSGVVTSAQETLVGVSVVLKGANLGTITNLDGYYELNVPNNLLYSDSLQFSYVGYITQTVAINGRTTISITLAERAEVMNEVVVTAVGIRRDKKEIGYSVQDLSGDAIEKARQPNMVNALTGKVAGVQVTSASGSPGASAAIRIRGNTSISGSNEALFVIDGIPIDNSYNGSNFTDQANRAIDINPDDIENISILKGAPATALYGIRAANGVVMITTKRGKAGKLQATFSSTATLDRVNKLPKHQNKYSQGENGNYSPPLSVRTSWGAPLDSLRYDGASDSPYNPNGNIVFYTSPSATDKRVTPYNNAKNFFQTGATYNQNLNLRGGNELATFALSLGRTDQTGVVPNTAYQRTSVRISGDLAVSAKLKISASANYILSSGDRAQRGSNLSGVMLGLMRAPVTFDLTNGVDDPVNNPKAYQLPDGSQRTYWGVYDNPYWSVNKNRNREEIDRLIGYAEAVYTPANWVRITYRAGLDTYGQLVKGHWDNNSSEFGTGRIYLQNTNLRTFNSDLLVNLTHRFNKHFESSLVLGHNYQSLLGRYNDSEGFGFILPNFYDISNINTLDLTTDDYIDRNRLAGVYADLTLRYNNYLFLNLTSRNDWTST